jgi:hypothetical protein
MRDGEEVGIEALIDDDQAQETVTQIGIVETVVAYWHQLYRIFAGQIHPAGHQLVAPEEAAKLFDQLRPGRQHQAAPGLARIIRHRCRIRRSRS